VPEDTPVAVSVARVSRQPVSERVELAAEFHPYQTIDLRARVPGYVETIRVDIGDHVRRGQLIATLKAPETKSELEQATAARKRSEQEVLRSRSDVERAKSELDAARLVYSRLAGVFESNPNLIARQEVDDALADVRVAEAELEAVKAGVAAAEKQVGIQAADEAKAQTRVRYAAITAPISGLITARYADEGTLIPASGESEGQAIVQLSQIDLLRLVLPIPESVLPEVRTGHSVQVHVPALGKALESRVARFSGKVDPRTRTMDAEVDVVNPGMALKPGMHAVVELVLARRPSALTVPVQAISRTGDKSTVLIVNDQSRLELRDVTTGIEAPDSVEIASGLSDHDVVVIGGGALLKPGQRVMPKDAQPASADN
jgi:RND family efflux transporter MFP subunit